MGAVCEPIVGYRSSAQPSAGPTPAEGGVMTKTARDIMTSGAECVKTTDTLVDAAKKMRDLDVGAMPICGEDDRLKGMITDRDIVTKCIAEGGDPGSATV